MSRRAVGVGAGATACLVAAAAAYVIVGGLPGLLYAGGVLMAALFLSLKLGLASVLTGEGRWRRKSVVIAELRAELEDREQHVAGLQARLEREADDARTARNAYEVRLHELENARDALHALVDEERARFEEFLGELKGGIGQRGDELAALERELTALVGG